jgi:hypothetical protein
MAVLVGIYLLDREHVEVDQDGQRSWVGSWTLFRLASGDRSHWESLSSGRTRQCYANREEACEAAQEEGIAFARMLQADEWLEPMEYGDQAPSIYREVARDFVSARLREIRERKEASGRH